MRLIEIVSAAFGESYTGFQAMDMGMDTKMKMKMKMNMDTLYLRRA